LLSALFKGYNATVLAYGQTGSGKTHTMGSGYLSLCAATGSAIGGPGSFNDNFHPVQLDINGLDEVGVIPRVLNDLFLKIEDEKEKDKDAKFTVKVSFVEVYNEEIKDLFNLKPSINQEPLNIREENNTIKVVNLSEIQVHSAMTTIQLLEKGSSLRVVGGTAMNDQSSRSHAIFTITLEQNRDENDLIKSKFHLVDLAGSERQSKTKAEGIRLKEGININLGLLALGNVISVLGEDNPMNKVKHVPYRESKLTRLLQDSLGGNSHTLMIACVSPADSNMEESLNTLRYADRARKIKNKPIVNIDPQAAEVANLRQQVIELKAHILQLTGGAGYTPSFADNSNELNQYKEENERLKNENIKLLNELQRMIQSNRITYERMTQLTNEKEELTKKFDEIKSTFEKLSKEQPSLIIDTNGEASNDGDITNSQNKSLMAELQNKLGEYDQLKEKSEKSALIDDADKQELNIIDDVADKDYAFRQAQMQVQLTEYDSELMRKQVLFQKMLENNINSKLDSQMDELKHKIESLEKEKDELLDVIRASTADSANRKLQEQKRDRLKQLETEVIELKRKEKEFQRMTKLREENEKHCEKLKQEIIHIKQERVKLLKQMRSDTDQFRKYKQEKEKEVNHLKALERKRLVEISKLQEGNNRQEAVLKRKNEEISRIQRQLRETAEKQKQVAEKRQQAFDRKESSALGEKLRQWISNELELSVGLAEARINLNKLIEERKESAAELARLQEKLNEINDDQSSGQPAVKRKYLGAEMDSTYIANKDFDEDALNSMASPCKSSKHQLELRIERIKEDIECKNVQITEIQQMVLEGDQGIFINIHLFLMFYNNYFEIIVDDRSKLIFNNIHGLLEAKVLLKHLFSCGVQYLLDLKLKQIQYDTNTNSIFIFLFL
jgi:kinesin family protein 4/21/27